MLKAGPLSAGVICRRDDMSMGCPDHSGTRAHLRVKGSHGRKGEGQKREERDRSSPRDTA